MITIYGINILSKAISEKEKLYRKRIELLKQVCENHGEYIEPDFLSLNFYKPHQGDDINEVQKVNDMEEGRCQSYIDYLSDIALIHKNKWNTQDWALLSLFDSTYHSNNEEYPEIIYKSKKPCKDCSTDSITQYKIIKNRVGSYEKIEE